MENRRSPSLNGNSKASTEQQDQHPAPPAPEPRSDRPTVSDTSLARQSLSQAQGVVYPASSINPRAATVGYLPYRPTHSKGDPSFANQQLLNRPRPTPQYPSAGSISRTSYTPQPSTRPPTSGLSYPHVKQSLAPKSRYMNPAIELLMSSYSRHLLDLAPIPIMQLPVADHRSMTHNILADEGSNTTESANNANALSDEEGPVHRVNENAQIGSSLDRLQQSSRDKDAPLDLSLRTTDTASEMSYGPQRKYGDWSNETKRAAGQVLGPVPPSQSRAFGQSATLSSQQQPSTSGQSIPTSLKSAPKSAKLYSRPLEPNTPPSNASTSNSNCGNSGKFQCSVCHESLRSKDNLKTHMRIHTGERPYACAVCGADFADRSSYAKHVNIHTGQREYACDMCEKKFTQSGNLARHKKTVHGTAGKCR